MWSNFHTHSYYCDGKGELREYLESARESGVTVLGFSSHAPVPFQCKWCMRAENFPLYLDEIESLKKVFPDIEIYKGLEIDFVPGVISPSDFAARLDFTIGSVHFVDSFDGRLWEIDNTLEVFREGLEKIFGNDIRVAVTRYLQLTREMVRMSRPDIVGHLDKIKMHNTSTVLFDESEHWYREEMDKTLGSIREAGIIIEVNTRGLYKKKSPTPYPSPWVLERIRDLAIPVMLNSDAHHPDELTSEFAPAASLLQDIGFRNLSILKGGTWRQRPFNNYGIDH